MQRAQGFAQQGGGIAFTAGIASATLLQTSYPFATITVYSAGTTQLAFIYSDNQLFPTPMSNPFTADANAHWFFYAANGRYDVMISSPELDVPWTIGDILLNDGGGGGGGGGNGMNQSPWLSNIDGGGFNLVDVGYIDVSGGYLINGVPMANPNLWVEIPGTSSIYHQGFVGVINQNPQFALDVQGGINCTDKFYVNGVALGSGSGQDNDPWVVLGPTTINYPGSVGINQASPQYALDIVGSVNVSAGNNFFINGVAVGAGAGTQPWTVLAGNRIWYAGQVGIGQNPPAYPLDVLGDVNITGSYRVNGTPISVGGGQGLWISGANNAIYYNGGNVGIGVSNPPTPLSVTGIIAAGAYALIGTPASPLINQSGQFVGAGVLTPNYGVGCAYLQATFVPGVNGSGNVVASGTSSGGGYVEANAGFVITGFAQNNGVVINPAGAFQGAGVQVGTYGIGAAYIQANVIPGQNSSGNIVAEGALEAVLGVVIQGFAGEFVINNNGAFIGAGVDVFSPAGGPYGILCGYLQSNGNVVSNTGYVEASLGFVSSGFAPNGIVINQAGAFIGAGVAVGNYGVGCGAIVAVGPVECQPGALVGHPAVGAIFAGGDAYIDGFVAALAFSLYGNPTAWVINASGQFTGAGVLTPLYGVGCAYVQATYDSTVSGSGNIVASAPVNTPGAGYLEATNGLIINGTQVINSSGQWIGSMPQPSFTSLVINGQTVITSGWQFTGSGGVLTSGSMQSAGSILCTSSTIQSYGGYICSNSLAPGGVVINLQGQFVGYGVATNYPISCSGGLTLNGNGDTLWMRNAGGAVINCASNGIWTGDGVQTTSDIYSGRFGIEAGGAAGSPGNFVGLTANGGQQFTLTTSLGNLTVRIIGGIICQG